MGLLSFPAGRTPFGEGGGLADTQGGLWGMFVALSELVLSTVTIIKPPGKLIRWYILHRSV